MAKDSATRGLRDEATVGPDPSRARDLKRLSELRYEVAAGEPDIRGWAVFSSTGREIGTVADLLVDTDVGEVVMLDVDLRRHGEHTLAPIRAAWVDHATRRVVLDARALEGARPDAAVNAAPNAAPNAAAAPAGATARVDVPPADVPPGIPALPRGGPLSDTDVQRFNDDYVRAYGDRAGDHDVTWRVARGNDEALQFAPRRLLDPTANPTTTTASAARASAPVLEESRDVNAIMAEPVPGTAPGTDRRTSRVDDASTLDDAAAIDPRELDARVRIDEGGTVDATAPVAGVRYEGAEHTPHDYGRPDEAYGPGHGSGRIGFNKIVTREPYTPGERDVAPSDAAATDAVRAVRYRQYDDRYAGPDGPR